MPHKDPEKRKQYLKEYRESAERKQYMKEYQAKYRSSDKGKKSVTISGWKHTGLISDDYDAVYDKWINTHNCECCNESIGFGKGSRVMDHCHKTGKFRNILCHSCNIMRSYKDNNYQAYLKMLTMD